MGNIDTIKITEDNNIRIDQFLSDYYEDISRSKISNLIKDKGILVNNKHEKKSYLLKNQDIITIDLDMLKIKEIEPQDLDISIIYQDEYIAVINKPFDIISHPTEQIRENTVVNFLMSKFNDLPSSYGKDRAGIVHRLDKDTSGLMIVALTNDSMEKLKLMFKDREIIKKYRAIVHGGFSENHGIIDNNISRSTKNRKLMMVSEIGKRAITEYNVIESNSEFSLLDIILHTGRTHQIRVHFSNLSHPILGDKDYNNIKSNFNVDHQLLQAYYLKFNHPITNQIIAIDIEPYPEFKKYYNIIFEGNDGTIY